MEESPPSLLPPPLSALRGASPAITPTMKWWLLEHRLSSGLGREFSTRGSTDWMRLKGREWDVSGFFFFFKENNFIEL